jgi:hypothetical protein
VTYICKKKISVYKQNKDMKCSCSVLVIVFAVVVVLLMILLLPKRPVPPPVQPQPIQPQLPVVFREAPPSLAYRRRILSGVPQTYTPIGYLEQDTRMFPLYGRASPTNAHRWNYHTVTDRLSNIRLPIQSLDGRDCTLDMGCNELYDGDRVRVPGFSDVFTVHTYHTDFRTRDVL